MRLHCYVCGKVEPFTATSSNTINCQKCGHEQSVKGIKDKDPMPRKANKKEHGSLTGSKRFKPSESVAQKLVNEAKQVGETVGNTFNNASEVVTNAAQQVQSRATPVISAAAPLLSTAGQMLNGQPSYTPSSVSHGVTIPQFDVNSAIGSDLYTADGSIPEVDIVEATRQKMRIARQYNALGIAHDKAKLSRKAVAVATELEHLKGDAVGLATARIHTETKVVDNYIAQTEQETRKSLLTEKKELLIHQQLSTEATLALTPHVAEKQRLRVIKAAQENENTKLDIQKGDADMDKKRKELETHILEATLL